MELVQERGHLVVRKRPWPQLLSAVLYTALILVLAVSFGRAYVKRYSEFDDILRILFPLFLIVPLAFVPQAWRAWYALLSGETWIFDRRPDDDGCLPDARVPGAVHSGSPPFTTQN